MVSRHQLYQLLRATIHELFTLRRAGNEENLHILGNNLEGGREFLKNPANFIREYFGHKINVDIGINNNTLNKEEYIVGDMNIVAAVKKLIDEGKKVTIITYPDELKMELYSYIDI